MNREFVVPGDELGEGKTGHGTYKMENKVYSAILGLRVIKAGYISVIPLGGRYIPKPGESVVGKIIDVLSSSWIVDLNSPYPALLHCSNVPWRVEWGECSRYLRVGDLALFEVLSVDEAKRVQLGMQGGRCRKLTRGLVIEIAPSRVPRVIGKGGSMVSLIKRRTGARIFVGQNGRVWVDGEHIDVVVSTIRKIEDEAHTSGLTDKIDEYLRKMMP